MIGIVWLAVFCVFCLSLSAKVIATSYRDPTSKTNVNVQTDLFRKSVGDMLKHLRIRYGKMKRKQ